MSDKLRRMAKTLIKPTEFQDLFNQSEPPEDTEQLKEALWQVHQVVWSPELKEHIHTKQKTYIEKEQVMDLLKTDQDRERMTKALQGVTVTPHGIPVSDVQRALSPTRNFA